MLMFGIGTASPSKLLSAPAMIFSRLDLPEPFSPRTPIFAPGKNDREMLLRMDRLGGTILPTRRMVYTYWAIRVRILAECGDGVMSFAVTGRVEGRSRGPNVLCWGCAPASVSGTVVRDGARAAARYGATFRVSSLLP